MTSTARQSSFALCIIAWFALLLQLNLSVGMTAASGKPALMGVVIYLGYFTVLTNLFVALALLLPLVAPDSGIGRFAARPTVQGCAVNAILLVGIGYHLLLRHVWNPQGMQWIADMLLHYVMPILFFLHWLLVLPARRLAWSAPLVWCVYPVGYIVYALARGEVLQSYPYPFIDVTAIGYSQSLLNAFGLLVCFVVLGLILVAVSNARARRAGLSTGAQSAHWPQLPQSGHALGDQHREEAERGEQRPLENDPAEATVFHLPGARVEREGHAGHQQEKQDRPAKKQHRFGE
ncbi:hypothetical protein BH11PSE13_BH11PSE13_26470 [soil metagenome]